MKANIHPPLHDCEVTCRCGNTFTTRSTVESLTLAICAECHPYITGKSKFVDAAGQVDKFVKKFTWSEETVEESAHQKAAGQSMREIKRQVRRQKEEAFKRKQKLDQAEEAVRRAREEEENRKKAESDAKKAASEVRAQAEAVADEGGQEES